MSQNYHRKTRKGRRTVYHTGQKPEVRVQPRRYQRVVETLRPGGEIERRTVFHTGQTPPTPLTLRGFFRRVSSVWQKMLPTRVNGRINRRPVQYPNPPRAKYGTVQVEGLGVDGATQSDISDLIAGGHITLIPTYLGGIYVDPDGRSGAARRDTP